MTIINPTENKDNVRFLIKIFLLLMVGGLLYIYFYIGAVDKKHSIADAKERISALEIENVDLESNLYSMTDPVELEKIATNQNFVFENNPKYLNLNRWVSDSSY